MKMRKYEPDGEVFIEMKVDKKKKKKLFRKFGEVRLIKDGQVKVLQSAGVERVYPKTFPKRKKK